MCNISIVQKISSALTLDNRLTVNRSIIEPCFNYCSLAWDSIGDILSKNLQTLQNRPARIVTGLPYTVRSARILQLLGWSSLAEIRMQHKAIMMYKIVHGLAPPYMTDMFREQLDPRVYDLQNSKLNLEIPAARISLFKNSFPFTGALIWNALTDDLKQLSVSTFKKKIKTYSFASTTTIM